MGLFWKRDAAGQLASTGHAGDDMVLAELSKLTDLSRPRHWRHYLYLADQSSALDVAEIIRSAGWDIEAVEPSAADDGQWVVLASQQGIVTSPAVVRQARQFFEALTQQWPGSSYDGWEASAN